MNYSTTCECGNIKINAIFSLPIEEYQASACDCDFCVPRQLAYLSDVNGSISFSPTSDMKQLKQGSEQATFWQCNMCEQVVAVTNTTNGATIGALSKAVFDRTYVLKPSIAASPKELSADEKVERWSRVWAKVVRYTDESPSSF